MLKRTVRIGFGLTLISACGVAAIMLPSSLGIISAVDLDAMMADLSIYAIAGFSLGFTMLMILSFLKAETSRGSCWFDVLDWIVADGLASVVVDRER